MLQGGKSHWGKSKKRNNGSYLGFFHTQVKNFVSESFLKSLDAAMLEVTEVCGVLLTVQRSHELFLTTFLFLLTFMCYIYSTE